MAVVPTVDLPPIKVFNGNLVEGFLDSLIGMNRLSSFFDNYLQDVTNFLFVMKKVEEEFHVSPTNSIVFGIGRLLSDFHIRKMDKLEDVVEFCVFKRLFETPLLQLGWKPRMDVECLYICSVE